MKTLADLADLECDIWGVPRKGKRTLFTAAIAAEIDRRKQGIERDTYVGTAVGTHCGRPAEGQRYAEAVKDFLRGQNIDTVDGVREHHDRFELRYFDLMEERRKRRDERLA